MTELHVHYYYAHTAARLQWAVIRDAKRLEWHTETIAKLVEAASLWSSTLCDIDAEMLYVSEYIREQMAAAIEQAEVDELIRLHVAASAAYR